MKRDAPAGMKKVDMLKGGDPVPPGEKASALDLFRRVIRLNRESVRRERLLRRFP